MVCTHSYHAVYFECVGGERGEAQREGERERPVLSKFLASIYKRGVEGGRGSDFNYELALNALGGLFTQWRAITAIIVLRYSGVRVGEREREGRGEGGGLRCIEKRVVWGHGAGLHLHRGL